MMGRLSGETWKRSPNKAKDDDSQAETDLAVPLAAKLDLRAGCDVAATNAERCAHW